jgi:four helix bundle protein
LEASSASIAQNIAEGKGHYTKKDFIQHLYLARGFLYKTVTLITIFHKNRWINGAQVKEIKRSADEIVKMLSSLITSVRQSVV